MATIVTAGLIVLLLIFNIIAIQYDNKRTYVYKGNKYYMRGKCLFKHPITREWESAVMYTSLKTGLQFVREENDFKVKFKPYKQWKNESRKRTKV